MAQVWVNHCSRHCAEQGTQRAGGAASHGELLRALSQAVAEALRCLGSCWLLGSNRYFFFISHILLILTPLRRLWQEHTGASLPAGNLVQLHALTIPSRSNPCSCCPHPLLRRLRQEVPHFLLTVGPGSCPDFSMPILHLLVCRLWQEHTGASLPADCGPRFMP